MVDTNDVVIKDIPQIFFDSFNKKLLLDNIYDCADKIEEFGVFVDDISYDINNKYICWYSYIALKNVEVKYNDVGCQIDTAKENFYHQGYKDEDIEIIRQQIEEKLSKLFKIRQNKMR